MNFLLCGSLEADLYEQCSTCALLWYSQSLFCAGYIEAGNAIGRSDSTELQGGYSYTEGTQSTDYRGDTIGKIR